MRRRVGVAELVRTEPQRGTDGWVELARRPSTERVDRVIERADALHGPVCEPLCERTISFVEVLSGRAKRTVGIGIVLEHAQQHLVGNASGC
jgi:hypothetical protein